MRGKLILYIIICSFGCSYLQAQTAYFSEFDHHDQGEVFLGIDEVSDGLVIVGKRENINNQPNNDEDGIILKVNGNGEIDWLVEYNEYYFEQFDEVITTPNGYYVAGLKHDESVTKQQRIFLKFSLDGNLIFSIPYGDTSSTWSANRTEFIHDSGDGIVVGGSTSTTGASLTDGDIFKFDYDGNELWHKVINQNGSEGYLDYIKELKDDGNGYIALLFTQKDIAPYTIWTQTIIKLDYSGNEVWRKDVSNYQVPSGMEMPNTGNEAVHVLPFNNGYLLLLRANDEFQKAFRTYLVELDANANEVDVHSYLDSMNYVSTELLQLPDGEIGLIGMDLFQLPLDWAAKHLFIKWGSDLNLEWYSRIGALQVTNWETNGVRTSDGGFASVGYIFRAQPGNSKNNPVIVKTDCLGNQFWNYQSCSIHQDEGTVLVFPNPSTTSFMFHFLASDDYVVTIYDANGKCILKEAYSNSNALLVDLSPFAEGVYSYVVNSETQLYRGRLLKF